MRSVKARLLLLSLVLAGFGAAPLVAQEEPLAAGSEGVPVPKKTKHVQPVYPAEALAQGIRGIVILDIVIDGQGKVASTSVLRSVPGLDEAAIAAARQWEYEPTKVGGKPVSVRVTVPITFSLALPRLVRQAGVPELRQGVAPVFPGGSSAGGTATAEVTLEHDGRIADARLISGEAPWSEALLAAIKTWRFSPPPDDALVSFRVEAEFVRARGSEPNSVQLKATGLRRTELLADSEPAAPQAAPQAAPPTSPPVAPAAPAEPGAPPAGTPAPEPTPQHTAPPPAPTPSTPTPGAQAPIAPAPVPAPAADVPGAAPAPGAAGAAPPPVEVLTAPPPAPPPENGISAIRDVTLDPGVPELARGRRPVAPPIARLNGSTGAVEVSFSVSAGGTTALQTAAGPDVLRYAAEQTVSSWVFRRTRADRAYLVAVFTYSGDKATALVRPQTPPTAAAPPAAVAPPADAPTTPPSTTPPLPAPQPPPSTQPPPR